MNQPDASSIFSATGQQQPESQPVQADALFGSAQSAAPTMPPGSVVGVNVNVPLLDPTSMSSGQVIPSIQQDAPVQPQAEVAVFEQVFEPMPVETPEFAPSAEPLQFQNLEVLPVQTPDAVPQVEFEAPDFAASEPLAETLVQPVPMPEVALESSPALEVDLSSAPLPEMDPIALDSVELEPLAFEPLDLDLDGFEMPAPQLSDLQPLPIGEPPQLGDLQPVDLGFAPLPAEEPEIPEASEMVEVPEVPQLSDLQPFEPLEMPADFGFQAESAPLSEAPAIDALEPAFDFGLTPDSSVVFEPEPVQELEFEFAPEAEPDIESVIEPEPELEFEAESVIEPEPEPEPIEAFEPIAFDELEEEAIAVPVVQPIVAAATEPAHARAEDGFPAEEAFEEDAPQEMKPKHAVGMTSFYAATPKRACQNVPDSFLDENDGYGDYEDYDVNDDDQDEVAVVDVRPFMQNRELSWLTFNERVLDQGADESVPLLERLNFISIFWSNLQEFFMVRVGSLTDLTFINPPVVDSKTGMTAEEQIKAIHERCRELYPIQESYYEHVRGSLSKEGVRHLRPDDLSDEQKNYLSGFVKFNVEPFLSPQIINPRHPFPHLENGKLYILVRLDDEANAEERKKDKKGKKKKKDKGGAAGVVLGLIPLPHQCDRVIKLPGRGFQFILLEHAIEMFASEIFSMYKIKHTNVICVTRNADIDANQAGDEQDEDYREHMRRLLKKRARLAPVRLECERPLSPVMEKHMLKKLGLKRYQVYDTIVPLDLSFTWGLGSRLSESKRAKLSNPPFTPAWSTAFDHDRRIMDQLDDRDILLSYPYESMDPFVQLLKEAAFDPTVASIKITLYRLASQSQLAEALITAAENGKDVTALFELRARFDESNNIEWSQRFEQAGCNVIYGFRDYKVHSKICCITRKTEDGVEHITQLGTGNYNEKTATLYTDFSFITKNEVFGRDAVEFFRNMQLENVSDNYEVLRVAPLQIKTMIMENLDRQIFLARQGKPCGAFLKANSITDKEVIEKIAEASREGVGITLFIRGICCLVPEVKGATENVRVVSIVGRLLEHSRIYCFGTPEDCRIYLSSADLMTRNLNKRVEIAWPILSEEIRWRILEYIDTCMQDTAKLRELRPNATYTPLGAFCELDEEGNSQPPFDAQAALIERAAAASVQVEEEAAEPEPEDEAPVDMETVVEDEDPVEAYEDAEEVDFLDEGEAGGEIVYSSEEPDSELEPEPGIDDMDAFATPAVYDLFEGEAEEPAVVEGPIVAEEPVADGEAALEEFDLSQFEVQPTTLPQEFTAPSMEAVPAVDAVPTVDLSFTDDLLSAQDSPASQELPPVPNVEDLTEVLPTAPFELSAYAAPEIEEPLAEQEEQEEAVQDEEPLTEMTLDEILLDLPELEEPEESAPADEPKQAAESAQPQAAPAQAEAAPAGQNAAQSNGAAQPKQQPMSINGLPPDILEHVINKDQILAAQSGKQEEEEVPGFFDVQDRGIEMPPDKKGFFRR